MSSLIKLTCWSVGSRRDRTFEVEIRSNDSIQQLKAALFEPSFQDVLLYKVDVALEDFYKTPVDDSFPANAPNSRLLSFSESLLEIFPEGPPRDNLHIVIQTGLQNKSDRKSFTQLYRQHLFDSFSTFLIVASSYSFLSSRVSQEILG